MVDIGCGGGIVAEPMARLGAAVSGLDPSAENIAAAEAHAAAMGLAIDYRSGVAADLAAAGESFDVILNLEVVEHVPDVKALISDCAAILRPNGIMIVATLNRTAKAFALAIVGAEYVLRWLPRGTHDWRKFVRPSELAAALRRAGLAMSDLSGMTYDPLLGRWVLGPDDFSVNYIVAASMVARG